MWLLNRSSSPLPLPVSQPSAITLLHVSTEITRSTLLFAVWMNRYHSTPHLAHCSVYCLVTTRPRLRCPLPLPLASCLVCFSAKPDRYGCPVRFPKSLSHTSRNHRTSLSLSFLISASECFQITEKHILSYILEMFPKAHLSSRSFPRRLCSKLSPKNA